MIRFLLNDAVVAVDAPAGEVAIDVLRRRLGLVGTKEGCREGDCGACAVLLGEPRGGALRYRAVCACLLPIGDVDGRHLVTIEGLNGPAPTPVQRALVDAGAVQCGFCTPGLVVALTGHLLEVAALTPESGSASLAGNLCRCTGYAGIRRAVADLAASLPELGPTGPARVARLVDLGVLPARCFAGAAARVPAPAAGGGAAGGARIVAGGTDLFVGRAGAAEGEALRFVGREERLRGVARTDAGLAIGAATTAAELAESGDLAALFPGFAAALELFASPLIRARATVGGNLANASPIGDLAIMLLALGAEVAIEGPGGRRALPLEGLYLGYKRLALAPGELIAGVAIPAPPPGARFRFEKVSRRRLLDIAGVNSAIAIVEQDGAIAAARVAAGGVAPVPLLLAGTSRRLVGMPIGEGAVRAAIAAAAGEIAPVDDVRGSAEYKAALLGRLLRAHFAALWPDRVRAVEEAGT